MPLKISDSASHDDLLSAAVKKREVFDRRFQAGRGYVLTYRDTSITRKIPGTQEELVLKKYKEWLRKPYSRINLYLSPVTSEDEENTVCNSNDDVGQHMLVMDENSFEQFEGNEVIVEDESLSDVLMITPYMPTDFM